MTTDTAPSPQGPEPARRVQAEEMTNIPASGIEARIEDFRHLTRDKALTIQATCEQLDISSSTGTRYESILVERTGKSRAQHLHARCQELINEGRSARQAALAIGIPPKTLYNWQRQAPTRRIGSSLGVIPPSLLPAHQGRRARHEARIEAFRRLTRDKVCTVKEACRQIGVNDATGSAYERELIRRTGLTRREHWLKKWRELRSTTSRPAAAALLGLRARRALKWDLAVGITDANPSGVSPDQEASNT